MVAVRRSQSRERTADERPWPQGSPGGKPPPFASSGSVVALVECDRSADIRSVLRLRHCSLSLSTYCSFRWTLGSRSARSTTGSATSAIASGPKIRNGRPGYPQGDGETGGRGDGKTGSKICSKEVARCPKQRRPVRRGGNLQACICMHARPPEAEMTHRRGTVYCTR